MIIAAYCGTGKSTFAAMYPDKVTDFVCMPYKYFLNSVGNHLDSESCKANPENIMRPDWPLNYAAAIKDACNNGKHLVIPSDILVLSLLRGESIPYILVYPQRNAKEVYFKRFVDRGNTEDFINIFIGFWDNFLVSLENDPCENHIVLKPNQFLSDVIDFECQ